MAYEGKYLAETPKGGKNPGDPRKKGRIRPWMIVAAVILVLAVILLVLGRDIAYNALLWLVRHFNVTKKPSTQGLNPDTSYTEAIKIIEGLQ